jgi:translation initiation factor 2B subunit (eIF-2B alpha/beta/delta family)
MTDFPRRRLAPISGSIQKDETAVAAAWRELKEETTLTPEEVDLWRQGKPYTFRDFSIDREWTVFPFLFRFKTGDEGGRGEQAIQLDWEHESWQWYSLETIQNEKDLGGVPHLLDSLRRVWFECDMNESASRTLIAGLEQLKADHQSGSHEMTTIALRAFRNVIAELQGDIDTKWWETARMAAWHLWKNGRESMGAATLNAFLDALADMEEIITQSLDRNVKSERLLTLLDHHIDKRKYMPMRIKQSFEAYLQSNFMPTAESKLTPSLAILTLSASSTIRNSVLNAFESLPIPNLDLRVLESRPLCEGVNMASSILSTFQTKFPPSTKRRLELTVHTDASAALASKGLDFVLLGADEISHLGSVSNKTGSLPAVLSAKHVCPTSKVLVLSELEKVAEPRAETHHSREENDPKEVVDCWLHGGIIGLPNLVEGAKVSLLDEVNYTVQVKNAYFEWVPAELIDGYICEEGTLEATGIQGKAQQVKLKTDKYFSEL